MKITGLSIKLGEMEPGKKMLRLEMRTKKGLAIFLSEVQSQELSTDDAGFEALCANVLLSLRGIRNFQVTENPDLVK